MSVKQADELLHRMISVQVSESRLLDNNVEIPTVELQERVEWFLRIIKQASEERITSAWKTRTVHSITNPDLSSHAHEAMKQYYGKPAWPPTGLHASERVRRLSDELAGRTLRSFSRRLMIIEGLLPYWLPNTTYQALSAREKKEHNKQLRDNMPIGTKRIEITQAQRQLRKYYAAHGRAPMTAYEVLHEPVLHKLSAPLDAIDQQQARLEPSDEHEAHDWELHLLLPLKEYPSRADWAWHVLRFNLPEWVRVKYEDWYPCLPNLQLTSKGLVKLLLPLEAPAPDKRKLRNPVKDSTVQVRAFSLDWGIRRLLTGVITEPSTTNNTVFTTGRPYYFQARGAQANLYRSREHAQNLNDRIKRIDDLLQGKHDSRLIKRREHLLKEKQKQWDHVRQLNNQLACTAAKWVIMTALSEDCNLIILEDLSTMESKSLGRKNNAKCSLQVRAVLLERIRNLAAIHGLEVIVVNPAGTSKYCPRCHAPSKHYHAPDHPMLAPGQYSGKNWLSCSCQYNADRDHAAAERIGSRGIEYYKTLLTLRTNKSKQTLGKQALNKKTPGKQATSKQETSKKDSNTQSTSKENTNKKATSKENTNKKATSKQLNELDKTAPRTPKVRTRYSKRRKQPSLKTFTKTFTKSSVPFDGTFPFCSFVQTSTNDFDQCPSDIDSPRSVSRGIVLEEYSHTMIMQMIMVPLTSCESEQDWSIARSLDGLLQANQEQIKFTRLRAWQLKPTQSMLKKIQETS